MAANSIAKRYPTKADIARALDAARRMDLKIDGFEIGPRGLIRVFVDAAGSSPGDAYDEWIRARNLKKQLPPSAR